MGVRGLSYTDTRGRTVNTAFYGAGAWQVSAQDYDEHDNPTSVLDADAVTELVAQASANIASVDGRAGSGQRQRVRAERDPGPCGLQADSDGVAGRWCRGSRPAADGDHL